MRDKETSMKHDPDWWLRQAGSGWDPTIFDPALRRVPDVMIGGGGGRTPSDTPTVTPKADDGPPVRYADAPREWLTPRRDGDVVLRMKLIYDQHGDLARVEGTDSLTRELLSGYSHSRSVAKYQGATYRTNRLADAIKRQLGWTRWPTRPPQILVRFMPEDRLQRVAQTNIAHTDQPDRADDIMTALRDDPDPWGLGE